MIKNILIILLLGIVLVAGCTQVPPNDNGNNGFQEKEISFETVQKSHSCLSPVEPFNTVITSEDEFKRFFVSFEGKFSLDDFSVDLSKEMVIGVFQGQKPTGGFTTEIRKITEDKNKINVYYTETSPGSNDIVKQPTTTPCHLVKIKKSSKEVVFIKNSVSGNQKPPLPPEDTPIADYKEIQLNKEFTLKVGESAILKEDDLRIKFLEVTRYGLCPSDVQCVRWGSVFIKIDARYDNEKNLGNYILRYGDSVEGGDTSISLIPPKYRNELSSPKAHKIEFVKVETDSENKLGETLDQNEYTATFKVTEAMTQ